MADSGGFIPAWLGAIATRSQQFGGRSGAAAQKGEREKRQKSWGRRERKLQATCRVPMSIQFEQDRPRKFPDNTLQK